MFAPPSAPSVSRSGYVFLGYYTDPTGGTQIYDANNSCVYSIWQSVEDMTLHAHWLRLSNITFVSEGDTVGTAVAQKGNTLPAAPTGAAKAGYGFLGYFTEATGGTMVYDESLNAVPSAWDSTQDVTLYARWIRLSNITFMSDGNQVGSVATAQQGKALPQAPEATKADYGFLGYFTEATDGTMVYDASRNPVPSAWNSTEDVTLYAHWRPVSVPFVVTLVSEGVAVGTIDDARQGSAIASVAVPENENHKFLGYWTAETLGNKVFNEDGSLIDHIFANSTMAAQVTDARMLYVANPHSTGNRYTAYSDHDPYLLTLNLKTQPEPSYSYKKVTEIQPGTHYIMTALINGNLNVANSVSSGRYYEYQTTTVVKEYNGKITMTDPKSAFIFEENGNGTYLIKDYFGRYVYQYRADNSSYYSNSVNVGSKMYAHAFSVTPQANGTFKILNTLSNCYYQGQIYNGTNEFGLFSDTHNSRYMPMLYEYDATATGITMVNVYDEPTKTRKVMINGNIIIVKPDGIQCTLQGVIHR